MMLQRGKLGYDTREQITGHGFPATARTLIRELRGWDREVIERHLAHVSDEELGASDGRATGNLQEQVMLNSSVRLYPWLARPLCLRYAFAQFRTVDIAMQDPAKSARWQWAFGMFAVGQFEVLGAWPTVAFTAGRNLEDLRQRGVERIKLISAGDAVGSAMSLADAASVGAALISESLGADGVDPSAVIASQFVGRKRRALLSAVSTAERLHRSLVRALRRRAPFASDDAATAFIAQWLERADRGFFEVPPPIRRTVSRAKVLPLIGDLAMSVPTD